MPRRSLKMEVGPQAEAEITAPEKESAGKLLPFEGSDKLKSPETVNGKIRYFPRYFIKRAEHGTLKLIRMFRKRTGKCSLCVATFNPERGNTKKRADHKAYLDRLTKMGIPVI